MFGARLEGSQSLRGKTVFFASALSAIGAALDIYPVNVLVFWFALIV